MAMAAIQNMTLQYNAIGPIFGQTQYTQIPMAVLGIVVNLITKDGSILRSLASLVQTVLNFLVVNAVCQTTSNLLHSMGKDDLAEKGNTVSKLYFICTVISVVCALVGFIPIVNILAGIASFVGHIITIVGYVLYLSFLSSGGRALEY